MHFFPDIHKTLKNQRNLLFYGYDCNTVVIQKKYLYLDTAML